MARTPKDPRTPDGHGTRGHGPDGGEPFVTRRDMAGWIGGVGAPAAAGSAGRGRWPGERLGLAQSGPTSMAGWGRRVLAVVVDWFLAGLLSAWWFGAHPLATLAIFAALQVLLVWLFGTTPGKLLARIQIVRLGGAALIGPARPLLRTVLLCLVVPVVLVDPDGRGLHDRLAGTVQIRM